MGQFNSSSWHKLTSMKKMIMLSGCGASGKTTVALGLAHNLLSNGHVAYAKMECIASDDARRMKRLGIPCLTGLSEDICPDHYLVSNLPQLWTWADEKSADYLIIETAGLCNRCSPATRQSLAICICDATSSLKSPAGMGPMLLKADAVVITKCDLVSQAEKEIIRYNLSAFKPDAAFFFSEGPSCYAIDLLSQWIESLEPTESYENDELRQSMPSAVCSYCVGEKRVGSAYQLGLVARLDCQEAEV